MDEELTSLARLAQQYEDAPPPSILSSRAGTPDSIEQRLKRLFSVGSYVTTTSSNTVLQQAAHLDSNLQRYRKIGAGACGTIFERIGTTVCFKLAKHDWDILWNDYLMHLQVVEAFDRNPTNIFVPRAYWFVRGDHTDLWDAELPKLPEGQIASAAFTSDRILPLRKATREVLIDCFCPPSLQAAAMAEPANRDCLVRIYLGRRRRQPQENARPQKSFSLRNLPLHLDQLMAICWDIRPVALEMAKALAILHWQAEIDANDVEFVLGSQARLGIIPHFTPAKGADLAKLPSCVNTMPPTLDFRKRRIYIWLIDFNLCNQITMDAPGVRKAVKGYFSNDPYYPRPLSAIGYDQQLWAYFRKSYLSASEGIIKRRLKDGELNSSAKGLPSLFVEGVVN